MHQKPNFRPNLSEETRYVISIVESKFLQLENTIQKAVKPEIPSVMQPSVVCKKMGWSRSKFEQFKREGLFRTFKIGGKVYVYTSDLIGLFPKDFF